MAPQSTEGLGSIKGRFVWKFVLLGIIEDIDSERDVHIA